MRTLLFVLAYLVPTFALGFLWHLKWFDRTYRDLDIYRPDIIIPFGFLSIVLQGIAFAVAYPRLVADPGALTSGLLFAAAVAVLSWTFTTLAVAAKHHMTSVPRFVAIETAYTVVQFLIVGPLLALSARI